MRIGLGLAIGSVALAAAVGTSWSASPPPAKSVSPPPTLSEIGAAARPKGAGVSAPSTGVSALSADECTALGGMVGDDEYGVCASKKRCAMVDNKGNAHSVCLSVSK